MEVVVLVSDSGLGEIVRAELHVLGVEKCFGGGANDVEAVVVLEGRTDVESVTTAEVPGVVIVDWVVDENLATGGAKGVASKSKGPL